MNLSDRSYFKRTESIYRQSLFVLLTLLLLAELTSGSFSALILYDVPLTHALIIQWCNHIKVQSVPWVQTFFSDTFSALDFRQHSSYPWSDDTKVLHMMWCEHVSQKTVMIRCRDELAVCDPTGAASSNLSCKYTWTLLMMDLVEIYI